MADLSTVRTKLIKMVLRLSSDQPGEVVAAATAIERTLRAIGADWHDLVAQLMAPSRSAPLPRSESRAPDGSTDTPWRDQFDYCLRRTERLSGREQALMETLQSWRGTPTDKQLSWLASIYRKLQRCDGI
jgi:hypothetical protein